MTEKQYKGNFNIEASAVDATSRLKSLNATLDGEKVTLPYNTSSVTLKNGNHILKLEAEDNVGNISKKTVSFTTPVENPDKPELLSPADGTKLDGNNTILKAKISDPTQDDMTVKFKKGYKYTAADKDITVKSGAVDYHPVDGSVVTGSALDLLKNNDGQKLINKSTDKFPYHMFEVKVPEDAGDDEIAWVNSVLKQYPNRKAILNFHEYLEVTGGLGPIPQRIQNEIVKPNPNVCMVFSGHYHSANQVVTQMVMELYLQLQKMHQAKLL